LTSLETSALSPSPTSRTAVEASTFNHLPARSIAPSLTANMAPIASSREPTSALPALATPVTSTATPQAEAVVAAPRVMPLPLVFQATVCFWVLLVLWQPSCILCKAVMEFAVQTQQKARMIKYKLWRVMTDGITSYWREKWTTLRY